MIVGGLAATAGAALADSAIDLPRGLLCFALGALITGDALTLLHYRWMIKLGKETSPFASILLLRAGAKVFAVYVILDMLSRWGEPLTWRFPLAALALALRGFGVFSVLRYVHATQYELRKSENA